MKVLSEEQYSDEWWAVRRGKPTASNFAKICTPAKADYSKQAVDYACQLVADLYDPEYGIVDDYKSAAMKNGTILEPEARSFYEFDRGLEVTEVGLCSTDDGRFCGSPDGLVADDGCIEIKSVIGKTQITYLMNGGLPNAYKPQCHGHLIVTGRKWCDFYSYSPGLPPLLVRVVPDAYTIKLEQCLEKFWAEYTSIREQVEEMQPAPVEEELEDIVVF